MAGKSMWELQLSLSFETGHDSMVLYLLQRVQRKLGKRVASGLLCGQSSFQGATSAKTG